MIRVEHIPAKRTVYSLEDLAAGVIVDWKKPVVIIGDGESKTRYIFNRKEVTVFGINRSVKIYPADMMVCSRGHFDLLNRRVPYYIPAAIIEVSDGGKFNLIKGANAIVFLSFVLENIQTKTVIIQGFNFTRSDQPRYNWNNQVQGFKKCKEIADQKGISITMTHYNRRLKFLTVKPPDSKFFL